MLRDIIKGCLLTWVLRRSDRKGRIAPKIVVFPWIHSVELFSTEGKVMIYDTDGTEWEAFYTRYDHFIHDLDLLKVAHIKRIRARGKA